MANRADLIVPWLAQLPPGLYELRGLHFPGGHKARSLYFDLPGDAQAMAARALAWEDDGAVGVYRSLNPLQASLAGSRTSARDADAAGRVAVLVDIDPVRPAGCCSTALEKDVAHALAEEIVNVLDRLGLGRPLRADSANGAHLVYPVDLPNDAESRDLVRSFLRHLDARFSTAEASVDTSVFNAARIVRVWGTVSRKGDNADDRPWRRSELIDAADGVPAADRTAALRRVVAAWDAEAKQPAAVVDTLSPGDDFDRRASWADILVPHGWRLDRTAADGTEHWTRPGKGGDTSATVGKVVGQDGARLLHVFSDQAAPFLPGSNYGPFRAYALLDHNGDLAAAARALASQGYGAPRQPRKPARGALPANGPQTADGLADPADPADAPAPRLPFLSRVPGPDLPEPDEGTTMRGLFEADFPEPTWLAADVVPDEGLTIISGPKKSGKTWLLLDLAIAVATGGTFLGRQCKRGPVLHYVLEDGLRLTASRLRAMRGLDPALDVRFYESVNLARDESLEALCRRVNVHRPALVVIDNLIQAKGLGTKENDNDAMGYILGQVHRIAVFYKTAIVMAHHAGRPKEGQNADPGFLHRGASAISGCTAANLSIVNNGYLVGEGRTYRAPFRWSMEFAEDELRWRRTFADDATGHDAFDIRPHGTRKAETLADDREKAELWLKVRLAKGDLAPKDAVEEGNREAGLREPHGRQWWTDRANAVGAVRPGAGRHKSWGLNSMSSPRPPLGVYPGDDIEDIPVETPFDDYQ